MTEMLRETAAGERRELGEDELHVWTVREDRIDDPKLIASYHALLTAEESARHDRFRFEKGRHQFLLTRALVRTVLSLYADVAPAQWRFENGEWGKPDICAPDGYSWLRFNLANTEGLLACAVTRSREIGGDVENMHRSGETVTIAERYFSETEAKALRALPESEQRERFFRYWTLKESYIKARGMGLQIPLGQFSFDVEDDPIRISFDSALSDESGDWQFEQRRLSERHMLALGVRRGHRSNLDLSVRPLIPLRPIAEAGSSG